MARRLRDLIKDVRAAKTAEEERSIISAESSAIRTSFKQEEAEYRHRNIAKLLYIQMLGYPTHWGQMECVKLVAAPSFSDKRMGYLALMLLMDEKQEVLTLVTNAMKNDLNNPNQFIVGLALCALGNISSPGIARDLAPEVEKLLGSSQPYIRKKAALCAIRVLRKCPDLMENFVPRIRALLTEKSHGVLVTGITLMIHLCEMEPKNIEVFRKECVPTLVRILKNLITSGTYAPEYDVSGITDPFLQVKCLHLLGILGKDDAETSDLMNDILAQVATNTDGTRNVGNAILYECVNTIMSIKSDNSLRLLAITVLGRFLSNRDNNIRYVALNTLTKVIAVDSEAVQRHRNTIVDCLKDADVSIRRRALDLIYELINDNNIKILAHELLEFLATASVDIKAHLAAKLCRATERYAPNKKWNVDTILRVLMIAGQSVPEEIANNLVTLIASSPDVQSYAAKKMFEAVQTDLQSQIMVRVAVWSIGEFGDLLIKDAVSENDIVDILEKVLRFPGTTIQTKDYTITALMKLSTRLSAAQLPRLKGLIEEFRSNFDVELQQRAVEYSRIFPNEKVRRSLLERIPVEEKPRGDVEGKENKQSSSSAPKPTQSNNNNPMSLLDELSAPVTSKPAVGQANKPIDLMSELFGGSAPTTTAAPVNVSKPIGGGAASVLDLLGDISGPPPMMQTQTSNSSLNNLGGLMGSSMPIAAPANPEFSVFNNGGLDITFKLEKQQGQPNVTNVYVYFSNSTPSAFGNFEFKTAVPTYMKMQLAPPSSTVVPPMSQRQVTQQLKLLNTTPEKPLLLKIKIDYQANGAPVSEMGNVTFPQGW